MACHRQPSTSGQHAPSLTLSAIEEIRSDYAFEARDNTHRGRLVAKDSGSVPQNKRPQLLQSACRQPKWNGPSSSTVEWAMAELIRHPEMMRKCQEELDSAVSGEQRRVEESDLQKLPYLQAVVKETFRLHPAAPLLVPRMAAEACEIEGYYIPKNARLMVNAWGMQRDPDVWERPLEFDPNRFVGSNVDVRGSDFQIIPFGAGRRICAGMSMGIRMVQLMLATLLHSFDLSLPDGQLPEKLDMREAFGVTMHKAVPLVVVPAARLPLHLYN